jgi:hypothetical protein
MATACSAVGGDGHPVAGAPQQLQRDLLVDRVVLDEQDLDRLRREPLQPGGGGAGARSDRATGLAGTSASVAAANGN